MTTAEAWKRIYSFIPVYPNEITINALADACRLSNYTVTQTIEASPVELPLSENGEGRKRAFTWATPYSRSLAESFCLGGRYGR